MFVDGACFLAFLLSCLLASLLSCFFFFLVGRLVHACLRALRSLSQDIYFCPPAVLPLAVRPQRPTARHAVPGVEGAFVLSDVLSVEERGVVWASGGT